MTTLDSAAPTGQVPDQPDQSDLPVSDAWEDDEGLPVRPVRRRLGVLSLLLCGAVVTGAGFLGGVMVEKSHVKTSSSAAGLASAFAALRGGATGTTAAGRTASAAGGAAAAAGGAAAAAGGGGFGGATAGTVKLIDGNNVYVTTTGGTVVKIATTPQSSITISSPGTVANIKPGDTVTATGATDSEGTVNATTLRDLGTGGGAGGGRAGAAGAGAGG